MSNPAYIISIGISLITDYITTLQQRPAYLKLAAPAILSCDRGSDESTGIRNRVEHLCSTFTTKTVLELERREVNGTAI
jgi:hypothetical protein